MELGVECLLNKKIRQAVYKPKYPKDLLKIPSSSN